jgi:hypothetical protein
MYVVARADPLTRTVVSALRLTPEIMTFVLSEPATTEDGETEIIDETSLADLELPTHPPIETTTEINKYKTKDALYMTLLTLSLKTTKTRGPEKKFPATVVALESTVSQDRQEIGW